MLRKNFLVPIIFITHSFNDKKGFVIGGFSRIGLGTDLPDDWEGRYTIGAMEANLESYSLNPVIAFRSSVNFSISAGVVAQYVDIELKNKLNLFPLASDADRQVSGEDWMLG